MNNCIDNPILSTMCTRSSIRKYTNEELTQEELSALSIAALSSPTAMDKQNQRYSFITNKQLISDIEEAIKEQLEENGEAAMLERIKSRNGSIMYNTPLFVVIANDKKSRYSGVDAGIAVQNLALCAKSLGLDSVIMGMPAFAFEGKNRAALKKRAEIDDQFDFAIGIAIGHRDMDKTPHATDSTHIVFVK